MYRPIGKHGANALFFLLANTPHGVLETLATTTLAAAAGINDTTVTVASATSLAAGRFMLIDGEMMQVAKNYSSGTSVPVQRGVDGTATVAHATGANVAHGLATDFANPPTGNPVAATQPNVMSMIRQSYTAAGAIAFGVAPLTVAIINGAAALAMTLANPTTDRDGDILLIVGNGKAAHTLTYTAGLGNGGGNLDLLTFAAGGQQCIGLIAANGIWVPLPSVLAGTLTNITVTAS